MIDYTAFAASRADRLTQADDEIREFVRAALSSRDWSDVVEGASVLWLEIFESLAPRAYADAALSEFQRLMAETLEKTHDAGEVLDAQVERVTRYIGTATVNDATYHGHRAQGGLRMRWLSMRDSDVRPTHHRAHGQVRSVTGTFQVGLAELRYPGDPLGPLDEIMNCRCLLAPHGRVRRREDQMATTFATRAPEDEIVDVEIEDDEPTIDDEIDEIPVHGIAAPEGVATGDGRMFGIGSLTNRPLPLPIRYEIIGTHGGNTSEVVTVGRIDEFWRDDQNMLRYRGVLMTNRKYTDEVIQGIADGTIRGVSVEVDDVTIDMDGSESAEMALETGRAPVTVFKHARVDGFTIVPIPAFHEAFIALGPDFVDELPEEEQAAIAASGCTDCAAETPDGDGDSEEFETAIIMGVIDPDDPIMAASSEQPPHLTTIYMDGIQNMAPETPLEILRAIATLTESVEGPIDLPVKNRGELGDEGADVVFLDGAAIVPLREKLLENPSIKAAFDAVEQYPEWTPHVTLGYPEAPATGEYAGESVRIIGFAVMQNEDYAEFLFGEAQELPDAEPPHVEAVEAGAFAPGTKDGPGWITHPVPTARIRRYWTRGKGAAKIRWGMPGDFNRCRRQLAKYIKNPAWLAGACANMHKEALGFWPGEHHATKTDPSAMFSLVAAADPLPSSAFENPKLTQPTGVTVDGDRVYGHIAAWGVCHIGIPGTCTTAPHSKTDYALFRTGTVITDAGPIRVGQLTMNTGHAGTRAKAHAAAAHYDNTGTVVADVAVGEDSHGIWFSGLIRPGVSEEDRHALAASGRLSGDWRSFNGNLELVAALVVNVPGFPIPATSLAASALEQESLVAAGVIETPGEPGALTAAEVAGIARAAVEEYRHLERQEQARRERVMSVRARANRGAAHALRAKLRRG